MKRIVLGVAALWMAAVGVAACGLEPTETSGEEEEGDAADVADDVDEAAPQMGGPKYQKCGPGLKLCCDGCTPIDLKCSPYCEPGPWPPP